MEREKNKRIFIVVLTFLMVVFYQSGTWATGVEGTPYFRACHVLAMNTSGGGMTAIDAVVLDANGTPPDTITTLTVSGPEGFTYTFVASDYYSQFNDYWHAVQGRLAVGEYTFTVTDNEGKTAVSHYYFSGGTNIPVPDQSTLQATGDPLTPTLSWGGISGYQGNLFYRARIYDAADNSIVWTSDFSPFTSVQVPGGVLQQGRECTWRVEAFDNYTYYASNQRAVTDRIALEIDNSAPYFNWATVFHRKDSEGDWIQIEVCVTDPDGDVPSTISSLKVYDPQDRLVYSFQASEYYSRWDEYGTKFSGTPDPGVYKFVVTDTDGNTKTTYDYVAPSFDIPLVDSTTLQASGDPTAPTLSWAAPAGMDRPLYYRVVVEDLQGNWIWASDRTYLTFVRVPAGKLQSGGSYRWYVRTIDASYWAHFSNQGRAQRVDLTIDNSRPFFYGAAVYKRHEPDGVYTGFDASVGDPDGTLPGSLRSLTVTDPNNNTYDLLNSGTFYSEWSDFFLEVQGDSAPGVYTFTATDAEGNTAVTHEWVGQSADIPLVDQRSISVIGDPLAPTISWSAISGYEGNLYYRIWVQDNEGNFVYLSSREPYTAQTIPSGILQGGKEYLVRAEAQDHRGWIIYNSRSNSSWATWSTEASPTNQPPAIDSFTANPTSGVAPLTVTFTCQAHDPDGTIASYQWDFDGDGTVDQTTTDGSVIYTYANADTYQAKVTVVDNVGAGTNSTAVTLTVAAQSSDTPWPMYMHDARHTCQSPYLGAQSNDLKGVLDIGPNTSSEGLESSVIGFDGTIYVTTQYGKLIAVNPDGVIKWQFSPRDGSSEISAAAIGSDGTLYVTGVSDPYKGAELFAIDPNDGSIKWRFLSGGSVYPPVIDSSGTIYVATESLYAINADGSVKWKSQEEAWAGAPAIGPDGTIYVTSWYPGGVGAFNPENGNRKWWYIGMNNHGNLAVGSDSTIYGVAGGTTVYAINADGTLKWSWSPIGCFECGSLSFGVSDDGTIYTVLADGTLYAINANNGNPILKWEQDLALNEELCIGSDGTIYVGSGTNFYAINQDGSIKWEYEEGIGPYHALSIGSDKTVYVGGARRLYAFSQAQPTSQSPTIDSFAANPPTPMDPIPFSWGTFPLLVPSDTPVSVAPGMISIAPKMNIPDCNDVAQPLMYAYLPDSQVGIDLSSLIRETCNNGVATFAFPDIDLSNYPGLVFDIYYGYIDSAGRIFYNTYEVTVSANQTPSQS